MRDICFSSVRVRRKAENSVEALRASTKLPPLEPDGDVTSLHLVTLGERDLTIQNNYIILSHFFNEKQ